VNIKEMSCSQKDGCLFLDQSETYFVIMETVESDGYYETEFTYYHEVWDNALRIEIHHADGTKTRFFPSLPSGKRKRTVPIYLKAGKNILSIYHAFRVLDSGLWIYDISVKDKWLESPEISPHHDVYDMLGNKALNVVVKSYSAELVGVTASSKVIRFETKEFEHLLEEDVYDGLLRPMQRVYLNDEDIRSLGVGKHTLCFRFSDSSKLEYHLEIKEGMKAPFQIISFDVGCANCTLLRLPNGKNLLIDSATEKRYDNVVDKYLKKHQIKIDYYLLTHFHSDHYGRLEEILKENQIQEPDSAKVQELIHKDKCQREDYLKQFSYLDSTMLCYYDELHHIWDLGGVTVTVLNSCHEEDGKPAEIYNYPYIKYNEHNYENSTSVSMLIKYKGFSYYHGADNYAFAQTRVLEDYRKKRKQEELYCDYFYGNHHFICDISTEFIRTVNPVAVYIPNERNVYRYSTYNFDYVEGVKNFDFYNKRLQDTLISCETGTVIVSVENKENWWYETYGRIL